MNKMEGNNSNTDVPDDGVMATAEQWFARMSDPACTPAERTDFELWLTRRAEHATAYHHVEQLWTTSGDAIRDNPALMAAARHALQPSAAGSWQRRRWLPWAVAAAAVLGTVFLVAPGWRQHALSTNGALYATAVGQQRTLTLDDGTRILMDTKTRLRVDYSTGKRQVDLLQGRAQFDVHHNAQRPFVVHAGDGTVTDIGTTFQVGLGHRFVNVVLLQGSVTVATNADGEVRHASIQPGEQLQFDQAGIISQPRPVDMAQVRGWTSGKLFVHDWTLPHLLTAMNQYSATQVVIGDPSLRHLRISGVFRAGDQKTLVTVLQQGWPVHATWASANRVVLSRK
ncbi:MAG TPA: FecR family protein [Rhodanobacteraceae bacterium]